MPRTRPLAPTHQRRAALLVLLTLLTLLAPATFTLPWADAAVGSAPSPWVADPAGGSWGWPLDPVPGVVHPFQRPDSPWGPGHRGIDLSATVGQVVTAVADGKVTFAGSVAGRGVVVVSHGRLRSTYEPVLPMVRRGDVVSRGTPIATLTSVGSHCLPHACLHLGARRGDWYVDPLPLLGGSEIGLKPLGHVSADVPSSTWERRHPTRSSPAGLGAGVGLAVGGA